MDKIKFQERLEQFYSSWDDFKNQNLWKNTNILVVYTHPKCESPISSSFFNWLFGYSSPNILLVLSCKYAHILCDENSKDILQPLEKYVVLHHKVIVKGKGRYRLADSLNGVLKKVMHGNLPPAMNRGWIEPGLVVGYIEAEGSHLSSQLEMVETKALEWKDVTEGFVKVMTSNDSSLDALEESEVGNKGMGKEGKDGKDGENKSEKEPLKEVEEDGKENDWTHFKDDGSDHDDEDHPPELKQTGPPLPTMVETQRLVWKDVTEGFSEVMNGGDSSSDASKEDDWEIVGNQSEEDPLEKIEKAGMQNEWTLLKDDDDDDDDIL